MHGSEARGRDNFSYRLSLAVLAVVLVGFVPTYWSPMLHGIGPRTPLHHVHGAVIFAWYGLQAWQARLVWRGRTPAHRELGLAGIALATLVVALGWALALVSLRYRLATVGPEVAANIFLFNVSDISLFAGLATAAFANTRRPMMHKRLIAAANIAMLDVAVFRWVNLLHLPEPAGDYLSALLPDLLLIALVVHDRRTIGRVHGATWAAIAAIATVHLLTPLIAYDSAAIPVATAFAGIAG